MKSSTASLLLLGTLCAVGCSSTIERDFASDEAETSDPDGGSSSGGGSSRPSPGPGGANGDEDARSSGGSDTGGSGGSDTGGTGGSSTSSGGSDGEDTTEPFVLSFSPSPNSVGVASDNDIRIIFSESMDQDSVESAVSVSGVNDSLLNFEWETDTRVWISIPGGWDYAEGTSTAFPAQEYELVISRAAKDLAGNQLNASQSYSFDTLRRITRTLTPLTTRADSTYGISFDDRDPMSCLDDMGKVGWWSGGVSSGTYLVWMDFNLGALGPPDEIEAVESAALSVEQSASDPNYYDNGAVLLNKLASGDITDKTVLDLAVQSELGIFSSAATSQVSMDLTDALETEWRAGTNQVVLSLAPRRGSGIESSNGDSSLFLCSSFELEVVYLTP